MKTVKSKPVCSVPVRMGIDCKPATARESGESLCSTSIRYHEDLDMRRVPEVGPISRCGKDSDVRALAVVYVGPATQASCAIGLRTVGIAYGTETG